MVDDCEERIAAESLAQGNILLDGQPVPRKESFRYLGSILQSNGGIEEDILHRTQSGWGKWRMDSGVLCDRKVPLKLKGKSYKYAIRHAMLYGAECWEINSRDTLRLKSIEMQMLRWACGHTRHDRIMNEYVRKKLMVAPIKEVLAHHRLRWFGHLQRRPPDAPV
ncbi:uncharacterized protein LOC113322241 [Papaver somniferum]|uniref:uncharacterized protein LOC113322241 n=1 Tax=Papaver somniferum TaxID=3469 RepID=UPI000E705001|nr:uncharacterized protein LOC113322241 [Papaver somniferum]